MQALAAQPEEILELQLKRAASSDSAYPWHTSHLCLPNPNYLQFSAGSPLSGAEACSGMSKSLVAINGMPNDAAMVVKPTEASTCDGRHGWSELHPELQVMCCAA